MLCCMLQLAGGVILGVALWLRHDPKTSNLLELEFDGAQAPNTFYISIDIICTISVICLYFCLHAVFVLWKIFLGNPVYTFQYRTRAMCVSLAQVFICITST